MQFSNSIINLYNSIEPLVTGTNVRSQISAWTKTHRVMPKNPYFLKIENCDDRWEFQRSYFYFGRYTIDESMYEAAVVCIAVCIALVVREIWVFYFQNLISRVLEQLHVIKWPLRILLIGLYQCWLLDCVRIEVLLVIWGRKVGLERGKHCDDRWEFQRSYFYSGRYTNDASMYEEAVV